MFCVLLVLFTVDDNRTDRSDGIRMGSCFLMGAILSATAGWIGMQVATDANVRTTQAARNVQSGGQADGGLNRALRVAFNGGAVMGFVVVGLGLLGVSIFMLIMSHGRDCEDYRELGFVTADTSSCDSPGFEDALDSLAGFGFGASSIALFARVAGGIYTKAADVGADLVGKVEEDIPEDSPENPATIADNVGDNVGDVAGMGADLFESFVGSIIACATLANGDIAKISLPFWLAGAGVVASMIGFFCVRIGEEKEYELEVDEAFKREECRELMFKKITEVEGKSVQMELRYPYFTPKDSKNRTSNVVWRHDQPEDDEDEKHLAGAGPVFDDYAQQGDLMMALHKGTITSSVLVCGLSALICYLLFDWSHYQELQVTHYYGGPKDKESEAWRIYGCILIGLLCGILIGICTEYCTSYSYYPVKSIAHSGVTGPATVIIQGLGVGMMSCFPPTFIIVATILACNALMAEYGVAVAAVSMLSTLGVTLATDAYGPIADNAGGLAEMVEELPSAVRRTTDALDALGNTTAATGKGFAIGSAVLTALSLLNAFEDRVTDTAALNLSVNDSVVLAGIVFGSMLPFLFGALTMISVGLAAQELIRAVRKDFVDKKAEEVAAIESRDGNPYKPWEFMNGKYSSLDAEEKKLLGNGADKASYEYYMKTVAGTAQDRKEFLEKGLEGGASAMTPDGLRGVVLKNVTLHNRGADSSAPAGSSNEEGKHAINVVDVVDGGRWHDTTPQDQAGVCDLSQEPVKAENVANEPGRWAERQSVFATHKWHGIRGWAPNSKECIRISTQASIREMMLPGVYAIFTPVFVGFLIGARMLMGVLAGSVGAGAMLAIMMANAGGAWDNSKKYIEIAGAKGGKGTDTHKACVVGDTVGDPFKDTPGPSLNILLKLMAMVSLTISTLLKGQGDWDIGWYALIPGFIIALTTFIYVYFIYGEAQADERRAEVVSEFKPKSPKKQTWHTDPKVTKEANL